MDSLDVGFWLRCGLEQFPALAFFLCFKAFGFYFAIDLVEMHVLQGQAKCVYVYIYIVNNEKWMLTLHS